MPYIALLLYVFLSLVPSPVRAQNQENPPLVISADDALEWDRTNQTFTALKNALAVQGDVAISATTLKAEYEENKTTNNDFDIHTMTARENVIITSTDNKAYGDLAVYDLKSQKAVMTGQDLKLVTPEQTITARDQFVYDVKDGQLTATGNATITRPTETIKANVITATLTEDKNGKQTLDSMTAQGNVTITTLEEKITGTYGTYNARTDIAEITGDVTLTRGPNILQGDRATVNLTTQISKLYGNANASNGRVTGTFYPGSEKKAQ